jgi:CRP/FNR family transcriptional regulator, anaerobic regulatory protein
MTVRADFPLHRPEILDALRRGDALIADAMGSQRKRFRKGDEIIRTGEPCDTIFRLESGWMARTRLLEDGRRSIVAVFLPGELFGVTSFLVTEQLDSVHSLSDATVLAIRHDRLRELFESEPSVALRIAFQLGEDERRLHNYVIGLGRANAAERIAMMLLEFHGRLTRAGLAEPQRNGAYHCPLTQQEMADFVGLTLVHVNRVLRRLHGEGLATVSRGIVHINDMAGLCKLAQPVLDVFERSHLAPAGLPAA